MTACACLHEGKYHTVGDAYMTSTLGGGSPPRIEDTGIVHSDRGGDAKSMVILRTSFKYRAHHFLLLLSSLFPLSTGMGKMSHVQKGVGGVDISNNT